MTEIERLAQVLADVPPSGGPPGYYTTDYEAQVRALLKAMREPTEVAQQAGALAALNPDHEGRRFNIAAVWVAMIDVYLGGAG